MLFVVYHAALESYDCFQPIDFHFYSYFKAKVFFFDSTLENIPQEYIILSSYKGVCNLQGILLSVVVLG